MSVVIGDWEFNHVRYDEGSDVLYLALSGPRAGTGEESPEGHILRFDEDGEFYGLTLVGVKALQEAGRPLIVTLPRREHVDLPPEKFDELVPA